MGFFLTDAARSAMTPPGTNARRSQEGRQTQASEYGLDLMNGEHDYLGKAQHFRDDQWNTAAGAVDQLGRYTTQQGRDDWSKWYTGQQQAQARSSASAAPSFFAGNESLGQSYALDQMNQANERSGHFQAEINSPEGQQRAMEAYLQGLGAVSPNYSGFGQLAGVVYNQPQIAVGAGLGDILGQVAARRFGGGGN